MTIESPGSAAGKEDVGTWPVGRVLTWLLLVDLQSLSDLFQTNGITGEDLLDLTDADLLSMGMTSEALRARVLREAATLSIASFA